MSRKTDVAPFLIRVRPYSDESLPGFVRRLADRNYVPHVGTLVAAITNHHAKLESLAQKPFHLHVLSKLSRVPPPVLKRMAYWPGRLGPTFYGQLINPDYLCVRHRRICPQCLRSAPYHRAIWDVSLLTHCTVHGAELLTHCPSCRELITWASEVSWCRCGRNFATARTPRIDNAHLSSLKVIQKAIGSQSSAKVPIKNLAAGDYIKLAFDVGWYASGKSTRPRPIKLAFKRAPLDHYLHRGVQACKDWPNSFFTVLDEQVKRARYRPGRYGFGKLFGALGEWAVQQTGPLKLLLRAAFSEYLKQHPTLHLRSKAVRPPVGARAMTLVNAQRILRKPRARVRTVLMLMGSVLASDGRGQGAPIMVRSTDVARLKGDLTRLMTRAQVRRHLNLSVKQLQYLLKAGFPKEASGPAADLLPFATWWRHDIDIYLASLKRRRNKASGMSIALPDAINLAHRRGLAIATLMEAIRSGAVPTHLLPGRTGFAAIAIRRIHLEQMLPISKPDGLSIEDVAKNLGVHREAAFQLVNHGLLRPRDPQKRRGRRITSEALEAFQRQYVFGSQFRLNHGHRRGWVSEQLIEFGAKPVLGPGFNGRQFLFRRSDVRRIAKEKRNPFAMPQALRFALLSLESI